MSEPRFVHLRLHSEFSIADGMVRLDDIVQAAVSDGQGALALTDLGNAFGLVRFYTEARGKGVKPIVGCDAWITHHADRDKPARLLLLVRNARGYLNLCELLSRAWLTNQYRGRAEIDPAWFDAESGLTDGLLALSGAQQGDIGLAFAAGNDEAAQRHARRWAALFPDAFYIELQRCGQPGGEAYVQQALALAARLALPVVATHPMQFMSADDFTAHEARVCISEGDLLANPRRPKRFTTAQCFRTQDEMAALFADIPSALANTVEIARRCNLTLELGKPRLPLFPTPDGLSLNDYLAQLSKAGLEKRLTQLYPDEAVRDAQRARYYERLEFECHTIVEMGFPGYFLIVADFINWAKNNGVPVGPGRGSGAGSLVAYALGITDLDPLRYNLLFERFLNPERVSMPDFDIDFCQHGRDRVIHYVKEKYGADAVSQIATFGTMAAKAAVRDIGRVLDLGYSFTDGVARLIPFKPGKHVTIADALKEEPLLQERYDGEDEVRQLLDLAQRVEGLTRNVGMHAGGVLIAPGKLTDFCPLYTQGDESGVVSQYDKDDVEAVGLVKFDFLGLTTLTILDWAERYIRMLDPAKKDWSLAHAPLDDPAAFQILKKANSVAVFQFESRGMQGMLKDAQPDCLEDIIALVALYRPGPMDLIPSFCARKHGREPVEYPDPRVVPILKETYGIMVYQEQVMQMAQIIGGYSLGGADLLRRAMGKKKPEEMARHREIFAEGAAKNGLTRAQSDEIFDLMEKFAGYGFNKSHAAAYALLAYYTAWLKAHHLAAFMAANLSLAMDDTDKVKTLFEDCLANGLRVLPPDVNASAYRFEPVAEAGGKGGSEGRNAGRDEGHAAGRSDKRGEKGNDKGNDTGAEGRSRTIRYGLGAIKGSGQSAVEEILRAREADGPFKDLFDFCARVDRRIVNRRTIEAMIRAGAFDVLDANQGNANRDGANLDGIGQASGADRGASAAPANRARLLASVGLAMEAADQADANALQAGLFDMGDAPLAAHALVDEPAWPEKRRLQEEKGALGFYLSGHLFDAYRDEVRRFARQKLGELKEGREKLVAGVIASLRTQMTQRGKMLVALIDDGTGQCEVTVFNEQYEAHRPLFREDELLVVQGQARNDAFTGGIRFTADTVMDLACARSRYARAVQVRMAGHANARGNAQALRAVLEEHRADAAPAPLGETRVRAGKGGKGAHGGGHGGNGGHGGSHGSSRGERAQAAMPEGLAVQIVYRNERAEGQMRLGDAWRVKPTDDLLAALRGELAGSQIEIVY